MSEESPNQPSDDPGDTAMFNADDPEKSGIILADETPQVEDKKESPEGNLQTALSALGNLSRGSDKSASPDDSSGMELQNPPNLIVACAMESGENGGRVGRYIGKNCITSGRTYEDIILDLSRFTGEGLGEKLVAIAKKGATNNTGVFDEESYNKLLDRLKSIAKLARGNAAPKLEDFVQSYTELHPKKKRVVAYRKVATRNKFLVLLASRNIPFISSLASKILSPNRRTTQPVTQNTSGTEAVVAGTGFTAAELNGPDAKKMRVALEQTGEIPTDLFNKNRNLGSYLSIEFNNRT